jgi:hypothetical protein
LPRAARTPMLCARTGCAGEKGWDTVAEVAAAGEGGGGCRAWRLQSSLLSEQDFFGCGTPWGVGYELAAISQRKTPARHRDGLPVDLSVLLTSPDRHRPGRNRPSGTGKTGAR